ncbi:hypothetical protein ACWENS_10425 [Streptomyces sp. NPDC004532]
MTETTAPVCEPMVVLVGDIYCLDRDCSHEVQGDAAYCDDVREEQVCATHSKSVMAEDSFDEIVHAEPWPCKHAEAVA